MSLYEGKLDTIHICGLGAAVPVRVLDNRQIVEKYGNRRSARQIKLTGVRHRHVCAPGQSASDLATVAARAVLEKAGWKPEEIKILIFVTQHPDMARPSTAMLIQKALDIPNGCSCFDVNMGCTGFTVGLQIIGSMLSVVGGKGLLLMGDSRYRGEGYYNSVEDLLFGDAGAAVAVETKPGWPMLFDQYTDGRRFDVIMCRNNGCSQMDSNAVFLLALNEVSAAVREFREKNHLAEQDIDYYVYHQAQEMELMGIAHETNVDWAKFLNSYAEYGNTSSASEALSICYNLDKLQDKPVHNFLMHGFGIGLSWGSVYMPIETSAILPVMETDYCNPDKKIL